MNRDDLSWKLKKAKHVVQDEWIDFRSCDYELPDGAVIGPVYNYSKHSFSVIVATDEQGRYICVVQYRHGIDEITTEFPAGAVEYKEKSDVPYITFDNIVASEEDAFETAKRELSEETGYISDDWKHLYTVPANATLSNSNVHFYRAKNCRKVSGQSLDDSEFLNVVLLDEEELKRRIYQGDFKQALHSLAYFMAKESD